MRRAGDRMADATSPTDAVVVAQPVSAPLTRAAIFLVVTINPGADAPDAVRSFCADLAGAASARSDFATSRRGLVLRHGHRLRRLGPPVRRAASGRAAPVPRDSAPARATRSPRPATCCSTSAPSGWTSASNWRRRSWRLGRRGHGGRRGAWLSLFRRARPAGLRRRHREPARGRRRSRPPSSATRMPPSPAAAT